MAGTLFPREGYLLYLRTAVTRSFWFIPGVIMLAGVGLAFLTHQVDQLLAAGSFALPGFFPEITMESARQALATIAGSMVTVASLVFSLTLVVLTLAAGTMGARLVETWTDNRVNQTALGLFLASFLHALLVLVMAGGGNVVPVISVYAAAAGAAVNSGWLIYFVHNLSQQIRIDNTIARITSQYRELVDAAVSAVPDNGENPARRARFPSGRGKRTSEVGIGSTGYVQTIDLAALSEFACDNDCHIRLRYRPGAYLVRGTKVAEIVHRGDDGERLAPQVARAFVIGPSRTGAQDFEFQIELLVEIAVRALSPGVNDLYTAYAAIDHLSGCLAYTLKVDLPPRIVCDGEGDNRIWTENVSFPDILETAVAPIRQFAAAQAPAMIRLLSALNTTARFATKDADSKEISRQARLCVKAAQETMRSPTELAVIKSEARRLDCR